MRTPNDPFFGAQPIWLDTAADDQYADFMPQYELLPGHDYTLRIASDGDWNVWAGDRLCGFGQYADYPGRVIYNDVKLPADGGRFTVTAWHIGQDSFTYIRHDAYVIFCLFDGGEPVLRSDASVPCAPSARYISYRRKEITPQMGLGFSCDFTAVPEEPVPASPVSTVFTKILPRPNRPLVMEAPVTGKLIKKGVYAQKAGETSADAAVIMKNAVLDGENAEGEYYLYDLGAETVGFPDVTVVTDAPARIMVGWGEHLTDGMCRAAVAIRSFSFFWQVPAGKSRILPALRRLGCRYLQVFVPGKAQSLTVNFVPVVYPVSILPPPPLNDLRRKIRDTAIHTLRCCMHEHYEDCPWREQSFYTLDSRNQMLAGYSVFEGGNAEMVRSGLDLISRGVRSDGLLSLCYPAGKDRPIPLYSLAYFIQTDEYLRRTGDLSLIREKLPVLTSLMRLFLDRITDQGLIPRFPDRLGLWNFYEWSPGLEGGAIHKNTPDDALPYEAPINAALILALDCFIHMLDALGETAINDHTPGYDADTIYPPEWPCSSPDFRKQLLAECRRQLETVRSNIRRVFYRPEEGLFASFTDPRAKDGAPEHRHVLTQALCLLCGTADGLSDGEKEKMLSVTAQNGGCGTVPATLSMACFRYDALLRTDRERFAPVILAEIDRDCEYMLSRGATTFWETILGEADFNGAGSLCHGWSAMAAYYYDLLLTEA